MERVKISLETEQEKLATLVKNLSADPSKEGVGEQKNEEPISEEWLQSLKERRKVSSGSMTKYLATLDTYACVYMFSDKCSGYTYIQCFARQLSPGRLWLSRV